MRLRRTADDVRRLAADPALLANPIAMSHAALGGGLLLFEDTARTLVEGMAPDQAAFDHLRTRGFLDMQRDLRQAVRPPETQVAVPMDDILPPAPPVQGPVQLPGAEAAPLAGPVVVELPAAPQLPPPPPPPPAPAAPPSPPPPPPPGESKSARKRRMAAARKRKQRAGDPALRVREASDRKKLKRKKKARDGD